MAKVKEPSTSQKAVVAAILANINAGPAQNDQWSVKAQAQNANRINSAQKKRRQQATIKQLKGIVHGGVGTAAMDSPLGYIAKGLDLGRAVVASGAQQNAFAVTHNLRELGILDEIKPPAPADVQAKNYAYSIVQDHLSQTSGKQYTPKQIDAARATDPTVAKMWNDAATTFYKKNGQSIEATRAQDKYLNSDPSFGGFIEGVKNHVGSGEIIAKNLGHMDAAGNSTGVVRGNSVAATAANIGVGIGADIAIDPLNIFAPHSASDAANAIDKASEIKTAAQAAGDASRVEEMNNIITTLQRTKTTASLTAEKMASIGERGGYEMAGHEVGGQGIRNAIYEVNPLSKGRVALGDLLDKTLRKGDSLNGYFGPLKAEARSGIVEKAVPAGEQIRAIRNELASGGMFSAGLKKKGAEAVAATDLKPAEMAHAYAAAQGNREAAAILGGGDAVRGFQRVAPINKWFTDARQAVVDATGRDIGRLDNYVPHEITAEMQARLASGETKKASLFSVISDRAKTREIGPGSKLFGDVVPEGLDPSQVVAWANAKSKELFGHEMYKTSLTDLMDSYARWAGKSIARGNRDMAFAEAGLFTKDPKAVNGLTKAVNEAGAEYEALAQRVSAGPPPVGTAGRSMPTEQLSSLAQEAASATRVPEAKAAYTSADMWAKESAAATAAGDTFHAELAQSRSLEDYLLGQMHDTGQRLDSLTAKMTAAKATSIHDLTDEAVRKFFPTTHDLDPRVQDHLRQIAEAMGPRGGPEWMRHYDRLLNWIKSWQVATPRFLGHITIGHAWNNFLASIDIGIYPKYWEANSAMKSGPEAWARYAESNPEVAAAFREVSGRVKGSMGDVSSVELGAQGDKATWKLTRDNVLPFYARKGGERIQHMMRVSLGMDEMLNHGGSIDSALERIATYHFDYGDLSHFEKSWVKRVIPFYTWTRRNVPLQLEMLAKNPKVFQNWNTAVRNISENAGPADSMVPSYFAALGAFKAGSVNGTSIYGSSEMTPMKELQEYTTDPKSTLLGAMATPLKVPIETWAGKQFFHDMPLSGRQVESPLPDFMSKLLETAGMAQQGKDGSYTISDKLNNAINGLLPMTPNANKVAGSKPDDVSNKIDLLSLMTGINLRTNSQSDQELWKSIKKSQAKAAKKAAAAEKKGLEPFQITLYGKPKKH